MFTSTVELQTGEIGDDFTYYFTSSEQTPSAVGLGVLVNEDQSVRQAGGIIINLPNATEDNCPNRKCFPLLKDVQGTVTELFEEGLSILDIANKLSNDTAKVLAEKAVQYHCNCSKEKIRLVVKKIRR